MIQELKVILLTSSMLLAGRKLASVFAFRKQSHFDGHESLSFPFFDRRGNAAFKVFLNFGGHEPSSELRERQDSFTRRISM